MADSTRRQPIRRQLADRNGVVRDCGGIRTPGQHNGANSSIGAAPVGRGSGSSQGSRTRPNVLKALVPPHPQGIRHPIDVVKPRRDQRDLQYPAIVKSRRTQPFDIILPDARRVLGQLDHILHHHPLRRRERRSRVILFQRLHQLPIERNPTQKLCV